jgi:putative transposase
VNEHLRHKRLERLLQLISFSGTHFPKDVILHAVFFYLRYAVSYLDLEEIMEERSVAVDRATLNRWVLNYL